MSLLDSSGRAIPQSTIDRVRAKASGRGFGQAYQGATNSGTFMGAWPARLQSADRDWGPARYSITARARDLRRNDPVAQAAVERKRNAAVGRGWRFISKPNARALGIDPIIARKLGQQISTELQLYFYSYDFQSDAERRQNFGQQLRVAASHLFVDGEFLGKVEFADDEPTRYKTRLRLIDPDRLSNPMGQMDSATLFGGVETNARGVPQRYWIRERHEADVGFAAGSMIWNAHARYSTPLGRPNILHGFDADRAGQTRGISRFAAALKSFRGFDKYSDATIQSAVINSLMVGYMHSSAGPEAVSESFSAQDLGDFEADREEFYKKNPVHLGDAILPVLPLGDDLKMQTATKDVGSFESFVRAIIRLVAASLGETYEEISMDYSQTNYSSARAAAIHAWQDTVAFMGTLDAQLAKPFVVAVLEEAFDSGYIVAPPGAPEFYDAIDAYCAGRFLGPARGYIDPTKEILAAAARIEAGISTLEDECAEQGKDYEDVLDQLQFEKEQRAERGLATEADALAAAVADTQNAANIGSNPADAKPMNASALARVREIALSAEHEAFLDRRLGV